MRKPWVTVELFGRGVHASGYRGQQIYTDQPLQPVVAHSDAGSLADCEHTVAIAQKRAQLGRYLGQSGHVRTIRRRRVSGIPDSPCGGQVWSAEHHLWIPAVGTTSLTKSVLDPPVRLGGRGVIQRRPAQGVIAGRLGADTSYVLASSPSKANRTAAFSAAPLGPPHRTVAPLRSSSRTSAAL
jgi:hypothetical protein